MNYTGAFGEVYAARYLRDRGYRILTANYRTRFGEIDIIAQKDGVLSFIEVKTRSEGMLILPREAVTPEKQRRLSLAAAQYLKKEPPDTPSRFDVIEVYLTADNELRSVELLPNAFDRAVDVQA